MERVGHKEDSQQLVEGRELFLVKRIPRVFFPRRGGMEDA